MTVDKHDESLMFLLLSGAPLSISLSKVFKILSNWSSIICIMLHSSCTHVYNLLLPPYKSYFLQFGMFDSILFKRRLKKIPFLCQVNSKLKWTGGDYSEIKALVFLFVCLFLMHLLYHCGLL